MENTRKTRLAVINLFLLCTTLAVLSNASCASGRAILKKQPKERIMPEHDHFFLCTEEEMASYKQKYGYYPKEWWRLNFPFACGLVALDDPADYPKKEYGDTWHPNNCKYTYIITKADEKTYEIRTENDLGLPNYIFKLGDESARTTLIE